MQMARTNLEWVAQVSILRPGFLPQMGPGRNTQVSKSRPGPPTLNLKVSQSGRCRLIGSGSVDEVTQTSGRPDVGRVLRSRAATPAISMQGPSRWPVISNSRSSSYERRLPRLRIETEFCPGSDSRSLPHLRAFHSRSTGPGRDRQPSPTHSIAHGVFRDRPPDHGIQSHSPVVPAQYEESGYID